MSGMSSSSCHLETLEAAGLPICLGLSRLRLGSEGEIVFIMLTDVGRSILNVDGAILWAGGPGLCKSSKSKPITILHALISLWTSYDHQVPDASAFLSWWTGTMSLNISILLSWYCGYFITATEKKLRDYRNTQLEWMLCKILWLRSKVRVLYKLHCFYCVYNNFCAYESIVVSLWSKNFNIWISLFLCM